MQLEDIDSKVYWSCEHCEISFLANPKKNCEHEDVRFGVNHLAMCNDCGELLAYDIKTKKKIETDDLIDDPELIEATEDIIRSQQEAWDKNKDKRFTI